MTAPHSVPLHTIPHKRYLFKIVILINISKTIIPNADLQTGAKKLPQRAEISEAVALHLRLITDWLALMHAGHKIPPCTSVLLLYVHQNI
jgi:hypothetical protein